MTQKSGWREQREENRERDAGRAKRTERVGRRVSPAASHAAGSRMRGMTPLLRGHLGDSVTWSKQSMPLAP